MVPYQQKINMQKVYIPIVVVMLVTQLCPTLYDPIDSSPPGSSVHGLLQARILEWVSLSLLQGIFLTQGSNPSPSNCRQILYCLSHQEAHIPHAYLKINSIWIRV